MRKLFDKHSFLARAKCASSRKYFFFLSIKTTSQKKSFLYIGAFDRRTVLNKKPVSPRLGEYDSRKVSGDLKCSKLHSTANSAQSGLRQPRHFEKKS